jgi:hypothetical protein
MSGGASTLGPFPKVDEVLGQQGYSGYEYVWWLVHEQWKPGQFEILVRSNLFASLNTVETFLADRPVLEERVPIMYAMDMETIRDSTLQRPLSEVLMDTSYDLGPVCRVEVALQRGRLSDFDATPYLRKWGEPAGELLMALPEYLLVCRCLRDGLAKGKEGLHDCLFGTC